MPSGIIGTTSIGSMMASAFGKCEDLDAIWQQEGEAVFTNALRVFCVTGAFSNVALQVDLRRLRREPRGLSRIVCGTST
jgi:hypothetical protein